MIKNTIETRTITDLLGYNFYIPEYQRGYRWTHHNVMQLLNDIWDYRKNGVAKTFYCLQPVVVREKTWQDNSGRDINGYELIDGQQRLTTLHRIITYLTLEYLQTDLKSEGYTDNLFSIYYKTRLQSKTFLESNGIDRSVPDLYYMSEAYAHIKRWFEDGKKGIPRQVKDEMLKILLPSVLNNSAGQKEHPEWSVQIIWYEIKDSMQKSEDLFTRLNRGKIPLTSAELIKAKFVNAESFYGIEDDIKLKRRTQLIQIWDEIENQLNNPKLWAFISNEDHSKYHTKIEYLFDIITEKKPAERDPLFSFIHFFADNETADSLWEKWILVEEVYRSLIYWYSNKNYYHKIGYLIATGTPISTLVQIKKSHTKSNFEQEIEKLIASSISDDWEDLRFDHRPDHEKIVRVLLLTNIELTRGNQNSNEFFPFEVYKSITKSLEHVHAQNIEGINENKKDEWFRWLDAHKSILPNVAKDKVGADALLREVDEIDRETFRFAQFKKLSERLLKLVPREDGNESEYLHKIENLALLGLTENISLSNSVFEVKRRKVMELDKAGAFIPLATKRVFLKYYAPPSSWQHSSIWTEQERVTYKDEIRRCIEQYKQVNNLVNAE